MSSSSIFSLDGQRALVTGGSRGLGAAMAQGLVEGGAHVVIVSRGASEVTRTASSIGAIPLPWDVSDGTRLPDLVDAAEALLDGPIDIVVHAAGIQHREAAETFDIHEWNRVLEVNLTTPFLLSQEVGRRQLAASRPGSHIFVGSLTSLFAGDNIVAYTASKSGVYGVIRSLSSEWSRHGIRVNGVGPGYFHTHLTETLFSDPVGKQRLFDRIPMERFGEPEDLVGATVFLASAASSYVTGQLLMVDGGWSSR